MIEKSFITKRFNINFKEFFSYLFFLYFLYSTDSFYASTNINGFYASISTYIIVFMACFGFLKTLNSKYIFFDCLLIFVLTSIFCIGGFSGGLIYKFFLLFAGICFVDLYGWVEFKRKYVNILFFIALYSLVCFLFAKKLINNSFFPVSENVSHILYRDLFFTHFSLVPDYQSVINVWRNYGPFWEPGVYQIYLLLGFIFVAFDEKKIDKIKMFVFGITLFTTFSTAGFITFCVVLMAFFLKKGHLSVKIFTIFVVCFILIIIFSKESFVNMFFGKLRTRDQSSSSRFESLFGGIYISFTNPFGTGPYLFLEKIKNAGYFENTNGFIQHFGIMGWAFGAWYVYMLFNFVKCIENKNVIVTFILFIAIVMELCNEPLFYSLPFSTILFYKTREEHFPLGINKLLSPAFGN